MKEMGGLGGLQGLDKVLGGVLLREQAGQPQVLRWAAERQTRTDNGKDNRSSSAALRNDNQKGCGKTNKNRQRQGQPQVPPLRYGMTTKRAAA